MELVRAIISLGDMVQVAHLVMAVIGDGFATTLAIFVLAAGETGNMIQYALKFVKRVWISPVVIVERSIAQVTVPILANVLQVPPEMSVHAEIAERRGRLANQVANTIRVLASTKENVLQELFKILVAVLAGCCKKHARARADGLRTYGERTTANVLEI